MELAQLAVAYKDRGVVGFDLAGGELGNPARVARRGVRVRARARPGVHVSRRRRRGRGVVREAVHVCGAHRIGHATRLIEDDVAHALRERPAHRARDLPDEQRADARRRVVRRSIRCAILRSRPERRAQHRQSADERHDAHRRVRSRGETLGFTFDELCEIALNGFESAFLPWEEREQLIAARARARSRRFARATRERRRSFGARDGATQPPTSIRDRSATATPAAAIVLGSGLGGLADRIDDRRAHSVRRRSRVSRRRRSSDTPARSSRARSAGERRRAGGPLPHVRGPRRRARRVSRARAPRARRATLFVSNAAGGINRTLAARRPDADSRSPQSDVPQSAHRRAWSRATCAFPT